MKKLISFVAVLALVLGLAPLCASDAPQNISLRLSDAPIGKALLPAKVNTVEFFGLADEEGLAQEPVISVYTRAVPRDRYLDVLERALGISAEAPPQLFRRDQARALFTLNELAGFQRLIVNGRNLLEEAILAAEASTSPEDVDTLAYLRHRRLLATGEPTTISAGGNSFLGVRLYGKTSPKLDELAPEIRLAHSEWDGHGAFVGDIIPESGASQSGLLPGDVVVAINGIWIDSTCTLRKITSRARLGSEIELQILRDGHVRTEWAIVSERFEPSAP